MRLMYWYALTPVVIVFGGLVFLTIPFLALAVLTIVSLGAVAGLAWAIVSLPRMLTRAISRRWHARSGASPLTTAALHVSGHPYAYATQRSFDDRAPQLAPSTDSISAGGRDGAPSQPTFRTEQAS
jgi:hypothetical protein